MKILTVDWQCWHSASINIDKIVSSCKCAMEKKNVSITDVIDAVIDSYVAGLDDEQYYSWTDEAQEQVKNAVLAELGGEQLSMFD